MILHNEQQYPILKFKKYVFSISIHPLPKHNSERYKNTGRYLYKLIKSLATINPAMQMPHNFVCNIFPQYRFKENLFDLFKISAIFGYIERIVGSYTATALLRTRKNCLAKRIYVIQRTATTYSLPNIAALSYSNI